MRKLHKHICKWCNRVVFTQKKNQTFCSFSCSGLFNSANGKKPPAGRCKGRHLSEEHKAKLSKAHIGINNSPWSDPKRKEECRLILVKAKSCVKPRTEESRKKQSLSMMGKNVTNGNSKKNVLIRGSIESRLWREAVFARDNYTCQKCSERGGRLHPHHKKPFADYPELRFAIDNGMTLCVSCHAKEHQDVGFFKQMIRNG